MANLRKQAIAEVKETGLDAGVDRKLGVLKAQDVNRSESEGV